MPCTSSRKTRAWRRKHRSPAGSQFTKLSENYWWDGPAWSSLLTNLNSARDITWCVTQHVTYRVTRHATRDTRSRDTPTWGGVSSFPDTIPAAKKDNAVLGLVSLGRKYPALPQKPWNSRVCMHLIFKWWIILFLTWRLRWICKYIKLIFYTYVWVVLLLKFQITRTQYFHRS